MSAPFDDLALETLLRDAAGPPPDDDGFTPKVMARVRPAAADTRVLDADEALASLARRRVAERRRHDWMLAGGTAGAVFAMGVGWQAGGAVPALAPAQSLALVAGLAVTACVVVSQVLRGLR